jgi:hypothetical protein
MADKKIVKSEGDDTEGNAFRRSVEDGIAPETDTEGNSFRRSVGSGIDDEGDDTEGNATRSGH